MTDSQRYVMTVEYDGTDFVGWQIQPNSRTVQEILETALADLFGARARVTGAGRTDSGVHAKGQVAHFDASTKLEARVIMAALNARLPDDVTIRLLAQAEPDFHARFSASSRAYEYIISTERSPLRRGYSWHVKGKLDHASIAGTAARLAGARDFIAFSLAGDDDTHRYCHVFEAAWLVAGSEARFSIRANRFLRGMVRALVGGLVQVGRGRLSTDAFFEILESRDRGRMPMTAPPQGLFLVDVRYDADEFARMKVLMAELRRLHETGLSIEPAESGTAQRPFEAPENKTVQSTERR